MKLTRQAPARATRGQRIQPDHDAAVLMESALAAAQCEIERARKAAGLTYRQLATRMGFGGQSMVTKLLSGRGNPTLKTVQRALVACGYELRIEAVRREAK